MRTIKQNFSNYSIICLFISIAFILIGFIGISTAHGESISYNNSIIPLLDAFYGIGFIIIGCAFLIGFFLFRIKNAELKE